MEIFDKFKNIKGKFDSLFIFITHDITLDELKEKSKHQMELVKQIKDGMRRGVLCKRMYQMKLYLDEIKDKNIINSVFMVHEEIDEIILPKEWRETLIEFEVSNYIFKYGSEFDIEYLKDLFFNKEIVNVIHVNNNTINHYHLNSTKRKNIYKEEVKSPNIIQYIQDNNIKDKCIIHGVSVALKNLKLDNHIILNKNLSDEEILKIHEKEKNIKIQKECEEWLNNLSHPKLGTKIVFGKDINIKIKERMLEKLYCSTEMCNKVKTVIPEDLQVFELIEVKTYEIGDIGDRLKKDFNGGMGILFY